MKLLLMFHFPLIVSLQKISNSRGTLGHHSQHNVHIAATVPCLYFPPQTSSGNDQKNKETVVGVGVSSPRNEERLIGEYLPFLKFLCAVD